MDFYKSEDSFKKEILDNKDKYIKYKQVQVKKHKRPRINKKWMKRYGFKLVPIATVELFEKIEDFMNHKMQECINDTILKFADVRDIKF